MNRTINKIMAKLGYIPSGEHQKIIKENEMIIADLMCTHIKPYKHQKWAQKVRKGKVCDCCSSPKNLTAHHLWSRTKFPDLALEYDNGVALCDKCHNSYHKFWPGTEGSTPVNYQHFKTIHQAKESQKAYILHQTNQLKTNHEQ